MTVTLYQNFSDSNVVNKNLTEILTGTGTLREESSVITPSIVFETTSSGIVNVNYIYIQDWNKYYYVDNIVSIRNGLWGFTLKIDVLMTYKEWFLPLSGIIARQENLYNLYLDDDKFQTQSQRMYVTKAFPNRVQAGNVTGAQSFILTLAGGAPLSEE